MRHISMAVCSAATSINNRFKDRFDQARLLKSEADDSVINLAWVILHNAYHCFVKDLVHFPFNNASIFSAYRFPSSR